MLTVYRTLMRLVHTFSYPVIRLQAARGNQKWRDRLGLDTGDIEADLWLHAASVGEVKVLSYLYDYLKRRRPGLKACVTTLTEQGNATASKSFPGASVRFFPFDVTPVVGRVLDGVRPRCLVIAETEIWPTLIRQASVRKIPVVMVNGRMSDSGFGRYRRIKKFLSGLLGCYDRFFFKSEVDAERYRYFGVPEGKYRVIGDMKFDAPLWPRSSQKVEEVRASVGAVPGEFLLVAGSTRPGEEAMLLAVLKSLRDHGCTMKLVVAPRHVERLEEVRQICLESGVDYAVYGTESKAAPVVIIDRMGLLMDLYMAANLAFVGGTLVEIGGHNVLEPVWAGTPVVYGQSLSNVADAAEYIEAHNYGARVAGVPELIDMVHAVQLGQRTFVRKTEHDLDQSATAVAGEYILAKLRHA